MNQLLFVILCFILLETGRSTKNCSDYISPFSANHECVSEESIGEGSTGTLYELRNKSSRKKEILKTFDCTDEDQKKTFNNEFSTVKSINHPNVIKLEDPNTHMIDGKCLMVIEKAGKGDLYSFLTRNHHIQTNYLDILSLFFQLVKGVKGIHDAGFVHCDLKPENVVLTNENKIKIIDFDLAEQINSPPSPLYKGTLYYLDPRVFPSMEMTNAFRYDVHVDTHALGVILYFMIHGKDPFIGKSVEKTIQKIRDGLYTVKKSCPLSVFYLLFHLLAEDTTKRPKLNDLLEWIMFIYRNSNSKKTELPGDYYSSARERFDDDFLQILGIQNEEESSKFITLEQSGLLKNDIDFKVFLADKKRNGAIDWTSINVDDDLSHDSEEYMRKIRVSLKPKKDAPRLETEAHNRGCSGFFGFCFNRNRLSNRNLQLQTGNLSNQKII